MAEELKDLAEFLFKVPYIGAVPFELNFRPEKYTTWTGENWHLCIGAVLLYSAMIRFGPGIMQHGLFLSRKSYEVKFADSDAKGRFTVVDLRPVQVPPPADAPKSRSSSYTTKDSYAVGEAIECNNKGKWVPATVTKISGVDSQLIKKPSKAFDLRIPLAFWNFGLSAFSFIGMMRTVPYLIAYLITKTFKETVCSSAPANWGSGPTGFWVMLFIFSKLPELVDTLFIVLRKKPLIFLHWYHHITVLLFCWSAYSTSAASGLYFVAMNYTVHAMMYGYYCLQALEMVPKWFPTILITSSQIIQMFIGTGVCIAAWYYRIDESSSGIAESEKCQNQLPNLIGGGLMYASYLYLFLEFAVGKYFRPKSNKGKAKSLDENKPKAE